LPDFLGHLGALARVESREAVADVLARELGGESLLIFAPDPELGVSLPAPGFRQVLRSADEWRTFLEACSREGELRGTLPGPDGDRRPAHGCALPDGTAVVLLGAAPGGEGPRPLAPVLPLLRALFQAERQVAADEVRARAASEAVERSRVLMVALQEMRNRLAAALVEAEAARVEARQRADDAESLAVELQVQAEQLQTQATVLEELNEQLQAQTEQAEQARAAATEASRAKSEFLANMSHELRTPINAVIGYTDLLQMGISGPVTSLQQEQLERIRASSQHLLGLINDVLDLAKVEAGHMTVEHAQATVADVVRDAITIVQVHAAARGLVLEIDCADPEITFVGDADRVRQILVNLLSNAIKFTEPGGRVTVQCGGAERADGAASVVGNGPWTWVAVTDTGIGMAVEELGRIFQPFVQAESGHTRRHGGTGLGLTISRQLAHLMDGDLTAESEEGLGSRFTLWLPARSQETGPLDPAILEGSTRRDSGGG
jgi:signal transduction histidine kinase